MTKRMLFVVVAMLFAVSCATSGGGTASSSNNQQKQQSKEDDENAPLAVDVTPVKNPGPRKRIGILDFQNTASYQGYSGDRKAIAASARDAVTEGLVKSGAFVVVEREQLAAVLGEQALGMTGAISAQTAAKAGQMLGLQALITGKITDFNVSKNSSGFGGYFNSQTTAYHARVSIRMIDATTGEIWSTESGEGKAETKSTTVMGGGSHNVDDTLGKRALYKAIGSMMNKVVLAAANKPWSGAIAKVSKGKIYITGGSAVGLEPGSTLAVRKVGEDITDPTTGQVIGRELSKVIGKLQVAEHLNDKLTVCVASTGSGFGQGDVVAVDASTGAPAAAPGK